MKKYNEPEEEESGNNWMDTYGDLVTLLLCFFVLLYSFSSINEEKWRQLVNAFSGTTSSSTIQTFDISDAREEPIVIDSMVNYDSREEDQQEGDNAQQEQKPPFIEQEQINEVFDELYEKIVFYIENNDLSGQMSVSRTEDSIILRFNEIALFNSGSAEIQPENKQTLNHFVQIIADNISAIRMVDIEGHTDNVPISTAEFQDNWDLSTKRATNTLRILIASGLINETKLSAAGFGEYQPIAANDTPGGRAQNRRVDFVLNRINLADNDG